jgi:hypothetical protein
MARVTTCVPIARTHMVTLMCVMHAYQIRAYSSVTIYMGLDEFEFVAS